MNTVNIESRLKRYGVTPAQREKCLRIIERTQSAQTKSKDELLRLAKRVSFAGFIRRNKLILVDSDVQRGQCTLRMIPVDATADLMTLNVVGSSSSAYQLRSLDTIVVRQFADVNEDPHLTVLDVLAQIPEKYVNRVSAFCLHLEDKFAINGYNLLTQTYEYHVELFANKAIVNPRI